MDSGVAHVIDDTIYVNKKLTNNTKLYNKIIMHEIEHLEGNDDIDLFESFDLELFNFILKNPRTWTHFLPIHIKKNKVIVCRTFLYLYLFIIGWIVFIYLMTIYVIL